MENVDLRGLIAASNRNNLEGLIEKGANPAFYKQFLAEFARFISLSPSVSKVSSTEVIEQEGKAGVLPSPAKSTIVKAVLSGEAVPSMRISEEERIITNMDIGIDTVSIHALVEVNPQASADADEQKTTINTLLSIGKVIDIKTFNMPNISGKSSPSIRVGQIHGTLYLIRRGVVGDYDVKKLPLGNMQDVKKAIRSYQESLDSVLAFDPRNKPRNDDLAREVIKINILGDVENDTGEGKISVPIVFGDFVRGSKYGLDEADRPFLLVSRKYDIGVGIFNIQKENVTTN